MPNKIEQFLRVPLMAVSILAWGFVIVGGLVLAFQRLEFIENKATMGDVITLASLMSAIVLAGIGWLFVWSREKAERERIAMADAVILYRKIDSIALSALGLLITSTNYKGKNLLSLFPKSVAKHGNELQAFYGWLVPWAHILKSGILETEKHMSDLRTLYMHKTEFGDHFMNAIGAIEALRITSANFHGTHGSLARSFEGDQKREEASFYGLIARAANVALDLEYCRWELVRGGARVPFSVGYTATDIAAFNRCFYKALGHAGPVVGATLNEKQYAKMLEDVGSYYGAAYAYVREHVHSG